MFSLRVDSSLTLQLLEGHHAPILFALIEENRDHLRRWLPWLDVNRTEEDSRSFINSTRERYTNRESLEVGIWYREMLVGAIGFNHFSWQERCGQIGYWLATEAQGKGIITRSSRALIQYGFTEMDLNRVEIRAAIDNTSSRAIPERLGFCREGHLRQAEWLYDHFVDHIVYGLLAEDTLQ